MSLHALIDALDATEETKARLRLDAILYDTVVYETVDGVIVRVDPTKVVKTEQGR